jgi:hypothetical protein
MTETEKYRKALSAIGDVWGDRNVSNEIIREQLLKLKEEIDFLLNTLLINATEEYGGTMTTWVYKQSEPGLWTVGFYDPSDNWHPDTDHVKQNAAAQRVHYLNGGQKTSEDAECPENRKMN